MPLLHSRTHLITFRLSTEEYDDLKALCAKENARSISEFVRKTVLQRLSLLNGTTRLLNTDLMTLTIKLQELNLALKDVSERIVTLLGSSDAVTTQHPDTKGSHRDYRE